MEQDLCRKKARMFMIERVYKSDNSSVKVYELTLHTPAFEDTNFMPIRGNKSRKKSAFLSVNGVRLGQGVGS